MISPSQQMVFNSPCLTHKKELIHHEGTALNWLVQKKTNFGKDISNPFMADNLPKIVWFSTHHITCMKKLASSKQTALGQTTTSKESSNSFMAGVNTPRSDEDRLKLMELMVFLLQRNVCVKIGINAARLSKLLLSGKYAAKGFEQIFDFLSGCYIHYALTVSPPIYISCIKQFWNFVSGKRLGDVTRLQALVDKKKIVISEADIREIPQLNDAEGVVCLPNEEIFTGLAQMGYEKPSTKLTFYKAFFSSQWKFLIHTILQSLSAKRTSWNEFSTAMASAVICLSKGQRFNFSKYIFDSLVRNVDSSSKFYMYPRFIQLIIQTNIVDLSTHTTRYISPALTQKVFYEYVKGWERFLGEEVVPPTPMSSSPPSLVIPSSLPHQPPCPPQPQDAEGSSLLFQQLLATCSAHALRVEGLENDKAAQQLEIVKLKARVKKLEKINKVKSFKPRRLKKVRTSQRVESSDDMENVFNQGRMIVDMDQAEGFELVADQEKDAEFEGRHADKQAEIYNIDLDHSSKVLSMQEDDTEVQEAVEIVTTVKLMTEVVTAAATQVAAASTPIPAAKPKILTITAAPAVSTRRRKGVVIRDLKEELPFDTLAETPKVKDKGKGILIEAPKPMKKKEQIEMDAEYARKLQEEINKEREEAYKNIDWNVALDHNTEGYKMDFFKGKKYDEILPIFQAKFDANMRFLFKSREEIEAEDKEIIKSINETPTQKAAKRRKLSEEAQEAKDLRKRLEIVQDEDDDVFVETTPLAQKVPVVDYQIVVTNNKPRYKIKRADDTHQLYISFTTLLKNFDREDLEALWKIVRDRFSTSKPTNFSDEYLLLTLKTMFEEPDGQDAIWRNQKSVHGLAWVKRWKLLTSCGIHVITLLTIQLFLLVERSASSVSVGIIPILNLLLFPIIPRTSTQSNGVFLGDVNDAMGSKMKTVMVTSDPLALIADKTKKAKVKDYEYYKTKILLAKKEKDEQVLLAEDQAWMESSTDLDQEINANMVFMAHIEKC
nr:hypothetical protein [Tanacetum cinerariifolium]